jgi:hypothetical protein
MSTTCGFLLVVGAPISFTGQPALLAQSEPNPAAPTTIVRGPGSPPHSQNTTLRIAVRDVDSPDRSISQAYVVFTRVNNGSKSHPPRPVLSNDQGLVPPVVLDTGEYVVWVRRVGYREARLTIPVVAKCEQVLEVYLTQAVNNFDRCMVRNAGSPPCDPDPPLTSNRATFTTCAPAT